MTKQNFNKLTPAETERLAMLAEECSEVIQVVGKILRHGYESYHPDDPTTTNRDLLTEELCDVFAVAEMMEGNCDHAVIDAQAQEEAFQRKLRFTHHQGRLEEKEKP